MTGQITFIGTLDREIQPNIRLTVTAVEVADNDESIQTSRMAYVRVQVSLTDINDNSPIFFNNYDLSNNQLDIPYEATLSEGATIGTIVVNDVQAFDPDEVSKDQQLFCLFVCAFENETNTLFINLYLSYRAPMLSLYMK